MRICGEGVKTGRDQAKKRNPDAGTPGFLTRENCSRREARAGAILGCSNPPDCDHLYQRVTQCSRTFPAVSRRKNAPQKRAAKTRRKNAAQNQSSSMKAAARNYCG